MKIAAVGDLHIRADVANEYQDIFAEAASKADVLLLVGDLTDEGRPEEASILRTLLETVRIPVVAVLGNHDYQQGLDQEVRQALESDWLKVLDGEGVVHDGVGFAGIKGFGGGFGKYVLPDWGEPTIKAFVQEGINEMLKLERALAKLETKRKVVLMHYAPIQATLAGESEQLYPFLGVSRLEAPINRYGVAMVFHGHAHHGVYQGKTETGIPVYNVARAVLQKAKKTYALLEL